MLRLLVSQKLIPQRFFRRLRYGLTIGALCSFSFPCLADSEQLCGVPVSESPELADNFDELRLFVLEDIFGRQHKVILEVGPMIPKESAFLAGLRDALASQRLYCVTVVKDSLQGALTLRAQAPGTFSASKAATDWLGQETPHRGDVKINKNSVLR